MNTEINQRKHCDQSNKHCVKQTKHCD